ncbi:MAG: hypothetical protein WC730_00935 [Patescibacteria group bacterium]
MKYLLVLLFGLSCGFLPQMAQAQLADIFDDQLESAGTQIYGNELENQNIISITSLLIYSVLSIVGIILLGFNIYAGFLWMTAGGKKEQVEKAQSFLINAVIGLILILASYAIAAFVIDLVSGKYGGVTTTNL